VNLTAMSSWHVARLVAGERRADGRILEDRGTRRMGSRRVERHLPSSRIMMPALGIRMSRTEAPLPGRPGLWRPSWSSTRRSRRWALPVTEFLELPGS
jgi:hypothetical protein